MTVRCRKFQVDSADKTHWCEYPDPTGETCGTEPFLLTSAVCVFLSTLHPGHVIAVCEGVSQYGIQFVSVYYRKED